MPRLREFKWDSWAALTYELVTLIHRPQEIAVDTETTGLGFYDEPFCATLTWRNPQGELINAYVSLEGEGAEDRLGLLRDILGSVPTWVCHNAKFDLQKLILCGAVPREELDDHRVEDTQVIQALLNENERKALKHMARVHLGEETNEESVLKVVRRKLKLKKEDGYHLLPRSVIVPYALKDTEFTLRLYEKLKPQLPPSVLPSYEREIELITVLLDMESNGLALDVPYLEAKTSEYGARVMEGWQQIVELTGKPELNPQSVPQLKEAFADRGVFIDSTAEAALKKVDDELAGAILSYRSDKKMHTTYLRTLLAEQRDGLVHPWFNPVQARTGRMSSSSASQ